MITQYLKTITLVALFVILAATTASADGLPMKDGRYSGGAVVIIELTKEQQEIIRLHYEPFSDMKLTKDQMDHIAKTANIPDPPTKLIIARPADMAGECICGLANLGLIFIDNAVEIPVAYLVSDAEAELGKIE